MVAGCGAGWKAGVCGAELTVAGAAAESGAGERLPPDKDTSREADVLLIIL